MIGEKDTWIPLKEYLPLHFVELSCFLTLSALSFREEL